MTLQLLHTIKTVTCVIFCSHWCELVDTYTLSTHRFSVLILCWLCYLLIHESL